MLFNSYIFIFLFLPIVFLGFYLVGCLNNKLLVKLFLVLASLMFYGFFNWQYLYLIGGSLVINFGLINWVSVTRKRSILILGIVFNVAVISYFKYYNFFIENIDALFHQYTTLKSIVLPLAISFFTIQKIAFLIDAYRGNVERFSFLDYTCFVLFFPQLIAGPIVLPKEIFPQINASGFGKWNWALISEGFCIFWIGLAKKVLIADSLSPRVEAVFSHAASASFADAWLAALAFSFQIYFDFSGYTDMAIGLGKMFGINLPMNFNVPYSAIDIRDFWKRWHMTLSRFLREYIYIPLGGNRDGELRQYWNILIVMMIGGLWHGAKWTFVVWGIMHGLYICINHWMEKNLNAKFPRWLAMGGTFILVIFTWVVFRAQCLTDALGMFKAMFGFNGFKVAEAYHEIPLIVYMLILVPIYLGTIFENNISNFISTRLGYRFNLAVVMGIIIALSIIFIKRTSAFLYFQF